MFLVNIFYVAGSILLVVLFFALKQMVGSSGTAMDLFVSLAILVSALMMFGVAQLLNAILETAKNTRLLLRNSDETLERAKATDSRSLSETASGSDQAPPKFRKI